MAHVGYVEAFAVGRAAAQRVGQPRRVQDLLQKGYQHATARTPSRLELDVIV
jgi:hypothetical protein